jgi:hypothetical protein
MFHIQPFSGARSKVFDNARSIKIRKLLSAEAAKRSSLLAAGPDDSVPSNRSFLGPKGFVNIVAEGAKRVVENEDVELTSHASEARDSSSSKDDRPATPLLDGSNHPAGRPDIESTGCEHNLPHKLAALIAEVNPNGKYMGEHSSMTVDNLPAARRPDGDALGVGGVEELRREIERLIKATERATARDVELVELRAEIRSRFGPLLFEAHTAYLTAPQNPPAHQFHSCEAETG